MKRYNYLDVYHHVLEQRNLKLLPKDDKKFKYACKKAIVENPHLKFNEHTRAAHIYLNYILDFPGIDLGQIKQLL